MKTAEELWGEVDRYVGGLLTPEDDALRAALKTSETAGLPTIQITATQGMLLHLFARMIGARRILEIGTLGGYSTIWMARALPPGGRLLSLELDPKHAEVARVNVKRAGLDPLVEIRVGPALDAMRALAAAKGGPFDMVFVDADKETIPEYLEWTLRLTRAGSVIVVDNVVRDGKVLDTSGTDASVHGVRRGFELLAANPRVAATVVQTVGAKGYDGFAIARVIADA
jgi:predicted O-methyltransferase YrrM